MAWVQATVADTVYLAPEHSAPAPSTAVTPPKPVQKIGRWLQKQKDLKVGLSKEEEENVRKLIEQREAESLRQLEEEEAREAAREEARMKAAQIVEDVDQQASAMVSAISSQIDGDTSAATVQRSVSAIENDVEEGMAAELFDQARQQAEAEDWASCARTVESAIVLTKQAEKLAQLHYLGGLSQLELGDLAAASRQLEQCVVHDPENEMAIEELAGIKERLQQPPSSPAVGSSGQLTPEDSTLAQAQESESATTGPGRTSTAEFTTARSMLKSLVTEPATETRSQSDDDDDDDDDAAVRGEENVGHNHIAVEASVGGRVTRGGVEILGDDDDIDDL
eukprot:SAG31_NODE_414_length_15953_cov_2.982528_14_plen_337_part_00